MTGLRCNLSVEPGAHKRLVEQLLQLDSVGGLKVLSAAMRKAMKPVLADAKELVPVDTAELRDSLRLAAVKPPTGSIVASVGVKVSPRKIRWEIGDEEEGTAAVFTHRVNASWRWHFVELGTSKAAARPFLRPAFERNRARVAGILTRALRSKIRAAVLRQLAHEAAAKARGD